MKLAFCLYKYFLFGGLQRDFMRIAQTCQSRGHQIRVYTMSWSGPIPENFDVILVPVSKHTNHGRNEQYSQWVMQHITSHPVDRIVGFNKMPNLDIYYAADVCYAEKVAQEKGFFYRLTSRYRHYAEFEAAVFNQSSKTQLLMLTDHQISAFRKYYNTPLENFHILPPGISLDRKYHNDDEKRRLIFREQNNIDNNEYLLLQIGSDFKRKGVDRSLKALAALPTAVKNKTILVVVGQDKPNRYISQAKKLGIEKQVLFFSGRSDIPNFLAAADLLIHPAYQEAAGIVLLEAITAGLPVITTAICGYAFHIKQSQAGIVIDEPFEQTALNDALVYSLKEPRILEWSKNAKHYADTADLYSLPEKAADIILGNHHD